MAFYALTIFTGAFLLFLVQPLIGKYILPWFGGGPGIWTTCMLFFQVMLVGGYAYAHGVSRWLKPRGQVVIQIILVLAALASLPIVPSDHWKPSAMDDPTLRILALLAATIAVPYLVLSSTGPLIQHWFALSHPGRSPYRLFALSNAGSLIALVSYPFYFESHFTRKTQAILWSAGLALYAVFIGLSACKLWRASAGEKESSAAAAPETGVAESSAAVESPVKPAAVVLWLLLPACASALLLATTNKLCLDVAVVPFLWVLPLALYLLSFIVAFDNPRWYSRGPFTVALVCALAAFCWALAEGSDWPVWRQAVTYGSALFVCCLVCHGELYRLRPPTRHLTGYYLLISVGGALGGVFVALGAPVLFLDYYELHWALGACAVLFVVSLGLARVRLPALVLLSLGAAGLAVVLWRGARETDPDVMYKSRGFYGVLTVFNYHRDDPESHHYVLQHGRITHGLQFTDPDQSQWATTYFGQETGIGIAMRSLPPGPSRVGIVGLGTGTLAVYGEAGDHLKFYEINPQVEKVARSPFTYIKDSAAQVEIARGDARLVMEREPPQNYDILILDAFSSDSIPVHLLTREAMQLYERHLAPKGILAIHISNHYLDLQPIVRKLAEAFGFKYALLDYEERDQSWWVYSATWMLLSKDDTVLKTDLIQNAASNVEPLPPETQLWTDDFASLFPILMRE